MAFTPLHAESNASQARKLFDEAYDRTFGKDGCMLQYHVNIIGLYKSDGTVWFKGKLSKFKESRYDGYNTGRYYFLVDKKKKTIERHAPGTEKKGKYSGKVKFAPNNYNYSWKSTKNGYEINMKLKPGADGVKHVKIMLARGSKNPKYVKVKVGIIWITVSIPVYRSGGLDNNDFAFPKSRYGGYEMIDKR